MAEWARLNTEYHGASLWSFAVCRGTSLLGLKGFGRDWDIDDLVLSRSIRNSAWGEEITMNDTYIRSNWLAQRICQAEFTI